MLDDRHDEISDPALLPEVVDARGPLGRRAQPRRRDLDAAHGRRRHRAQEHARLDRLLARSLGGDRPADAECIEPSDAPSVGLPLGVFKAAQLIEMDDVGAAFINFTAIDLETTDNDTKTAEIVEIAAVRVRDGQIVERFHSLVKPRVAIAPAATATHTLRAADLADGAALRGHLADVSRRSAATTSSSRTTATSSTFESSRAWRRRSARSSISARTTRCRSRAISIRRAASS